MPDNGAPAKLTDDSARQWVNALVVVVIAALVVWVFQTINDFGGLKGALLGQLTSTDPKISDAARLALQSLQTNTGTLFGALTTFLGTAIGAYFGISVSASTSRTAVNAVAAGAQQNADTNQKLGASQQQLQAARDIFDQLDASSPGHPDQLRALRVTLK